MANFNGSVTPSLVGENSLIGAQKAREIAGFTKEKFTFTNPLLKEGADLGILSKAFTFVKNDDPAAFTFDKEKGAIA